MNFKAGSPNQKWATDVTQMNIKGGKIYLSPILDLFNGEIIPYSISKSPNMQMIDEMLSKAFDKVKDTNGLIFHSDQGCNINTMDIERLRETWNYTKHVKERELFR